MLGGECSLPYHANASRKTLVAHAQGNFQLLPRVHPGPAPPCLSATFPEENFILWVTHGVLLWADMNAATPLGALMRTSCSSAAAVTVTAALPWPESDA